MITNREKMTKNACLVFLLLGTIVFLQCDAQGPLEPNEEEKQICEDNKDGRTLVKAQKDRRLSCNVVCDYESENGDQARETYSSPDGQQCCDMVGGGPTGCCKDGKCPVGLQNCPRSKMMLMD